MADHYRIGIDVGGTNTDAVVMDDALTVVAKAKTPTTSDITGGIAEVIAAVLGESAVSPEAVATVMLGTTHATNAVLQRRDLASVAVIRVGGPATKAIPPLWTWPDDLRAVVSAGEVVVDGGFEVDGSEQVPFDGDHVRKFLLGLDTRPDACAVTSVFAPVSDAHEQLAADIVRDVFGEDMPLSVSASIGSIGLLERENACVLNAALLPVAADIVAGLEAAMRASGLAATTFFAQNDGTLMALERVLRYPVLTIGSGPANSMRGAAHLTGLVDAIVVDVGGTSTDIGVLAAGFPRESAIPVEIGGVRTNFRMPDLLSLALGGGTVIRTEDGTTRVGPDSVGYRLTESALCFGGDTPTLSDAAVSRGRASFGTAAPTGLDAAVAGEAIEWVDAVLDDGIDRMKLSRADQPIVAVGGGSVLLSDAAAGAALVHRPPHFDVANAIGAAIASVSAEIDQLFTIGEGGRTEVIEEAKSTAMGAAISLGADPARTEVVSLDELTMAYMTDNILRLRVKAAGPLV